MKINFLVLLIFESSTIFCKVSITVSNDSMTLKWNKSEEQITSYYSLADLEGVINRSNSSIYFGKLIPGTIYHLKLKASLNNGTTISIPKEFITKANPPIDVNCEQNNTDVLFRWWTHNECADYFLVRIEQLKSAGIFQLIHEELLDWTELYTTFHDMAQNKEYYSTVWNICNISGKIIQSDPVKVKCRKLTQTNLNYKSLNDSRILPENLTSKIFDSSTQLYVFNQTFKLNKMNNEEFKRPNSSMSIKLYLIIIISGLIISVFLITVLFVFKSSKFKQFLNNTFHLNLDSNQEDSIHLLDNLNDLEINRRDLEIHHQIGKGFFGSVYYGKLSLQSGRVNYEVAIKKSNFVGNEDKDIFLGEAQLMKNFNHPNMMTLIGVSFESDGSPLVILPFMKKGDLLSYLRNDENKPTVKHLIGFAIDVAKGMEYLSDQHFVHRDLAARNCMIDKNKETHVLCIKVADFGLTRNIVEKNYYTSKNMEQLLPIRWMSIESIDKCFYDTKTDVWSYGVLVWEIITRGVVPYSILNNKQVVDYLISGKRLEKPKYCPGHIYKMLVDCWAKDPKLRPTFREVKEYLINYIENSNNLNTSSV